MSQPKTHPHLGVKIRVQYGSFSTNKLRIKDFQITIKSGRFTGFSGTGNRQSEPDTGLFSGRGNAETGSKQDRIRRVSHKPLLLIRPIPAPNQPWIPPHQIREHDPVPHLPTAGKKVGNLCAKHETPQFNGSNNFPLTVFRQGYFSKKDCTHPCGAPATGCGI